MGSVNRAIVLGRVGRDPEIRALNSGDRLASFSVATSETWRDKSSGERKEKTEWHKITVWGDGLVKIVENYVRKGDQIYIEGKIETRKWVDNNQNERYSTEIVVKGFDGQITLLSEHRNGNSGGSRSSGGGDRGGARQTGGDNRSRAPASRGSNDLDDEIPFVSNSLAFEPGLAQKPIIA